MSKRSDANNHANQLNSNNSAYRSSRGLPTPPAQGGEARPAAPAQQPPPAASPQQPQQQGQVKK